MRIPSAVAALGDFRRDRLENLQAALRLVVVIGGDADRFDDPELEFARDDRSGHEAPAGDRDNPLERPRTRQPPGERAGAAMKLIPGNRKGFGSAVGYEVPLGEHAPLP